MSRIATEINVVEKMISMYCRHKEGNSELCPQCEALLDYARRRLMSCPHGDMKPTCRKCTIHCYSPDKAVLIKNVMRFSGPRMLLRDPLYAFWHIISEIFR